MADVFSKRKRSQIMSRIRSSGGPTEQKFRKAVREAYGGRPKVNDERLPGTPDVSIYKFKVAIFLDGCYWYGCPKHGRSPKSNVEFWEKKIENNKRRDKRVRKALRAMGWKVWAFWEHELKDVRRLVRNLQKRIRRLAADQDNTVRVEDEKALKAVLDGPSGELPGVRDRKGKATVFNIVP